MASPQSSTLSSSRVDYDGFARWRGQTTMLSLYRSNGEAQTLTDLAAASLPPEVVWLDLLSASAEEVSFVERITGLQLPGFDDLMEIEASSRLYVENGALFMSVPVA